MKIPARAFIRRPSPGLSWVLLRQRIGTRALPSRIMGHADVWIAGTRRKRDRTIPAALTERVRHVVQRSTGGRPPWLWCSAPSSPLNPVAGASAHCLTQSNSPPTQSWPASTHHQAITAWSTASSGSCSGSGSCFLFWLVTAVPKRVRTISPGLQSSVGRRTPPCSSNAGRSRAT